MWQKAKNMYHAFSAFGAAMCFGFSGKRIKVIGVTGTDGKTTTTHLIHHFLVSSGKKASMVSSVYAEIAGKQYDTGFHVTSPNEWMVQQFLKKAIEAGDEYMVLEVTSHGLDQHRVDWIDFEIGVLTNITHEHLDYHRTYNNYVRTKAKLLYASKTAVVNKDDHSFQVLKLTNHPKVITYGFKDADITPHNFKFSSPLPGEYNQYNTLAAIATCKQIGISDEQIRKALKSFKGVKGRFEYLPTNQDFDVIIDFAHTPNAIEKVLTAAKPLTQRKLIHVFGSAALRDHLKRPVMGANSAHFADMIVLTEEDFRTEDVNQIIEEIAAGCLKQGAVELTTEEYKKAFITKQPVFFRIPNRQDAIDFAIGKLARKDDVLVFTGKAHEKSLCRGTIEYPWNEHEAIKSAIKKSVGRK